MVIAMAATRKLQGEIDRCLKKVSEGVETFEDIWQKVHNATNTNQKEKYETDLKKEIKKLQRLRDQIKSWIASGEIKDKSTLVDTRKLIETQMERFKVVERETKTKAYSKEGLGATQKLDPTTREREDLNSWLIGSIDQMQLQMDQFESEIESIMAAKKKRLDKEKQDRLDELKIFMERHKFHMSKLETLMRMLDNLSVDVNAVGLREFLSQVKKIKDDIEYYLESSQEAEFEENEFLYDDIEGLEEQQALGNLAMNVGGDSELAETPTSTASGNISPVSPTHSSDSSSDPEKRRKSSDDSSNKVNDVVRPVALKPNHSPSPAGKGSGESNIETPPLNVETLNNSSPSSGLSNHVSSLSSLSSSPTQTHNYQNALNNVKSLSHLEEKNSSPTLVSNSNNSLPEPAPSSIIYNNGSKNSTTNYGSIVNSSPPSTLSYSTESALDSTSATVTAAITSTFNGLTGSSHASNSGSENSEETLTRLTSPTPLSQSDATTTLSPSKNHVSVITNSSSFHYSEASENGHESNSPEAQFMTSPQDSSFILPPISGRPRPGLDEALPLSSSLNLSSMGSTSNSTFVNHSASAVTSNHLGASVNVTSISGSAKSGSLSTTTLTNGPAGSQLLGVVGSPSSLSSQNINSACASNSSVTLTHLEQQQHLHPCTQDMSSPSVMDFMRMPAEQMLLGRYLNESGDTMTLKSMAQDAIDRAGIQITDPSSNRAMMEAHIPPLLGVAPLGPVPLQKDHLYQLQMLEAAHIHLPVSADSERMRQFLPRNPIQAPSYYPQHPLTNSDSLEFFQRLSIETLFFIFYYLEGTKAQYLAAKVLKKQSWRFHTKYMMWFQRHEEPKVINEDYEQGTYIYFDIEKWGQRKKDGFVFEYRYLEDRELS